MAVVMDQFHNLKTGSNSYLLCSCKLAQPMVPSPSACMFLLVLPEYECPPNYYLQYSPVNSMPMKCERCHWSCVTCRPNRSK